MKGMNMKTTPGDKNNVVSEAIFVYSHKDDWKSLGR
jgi:hypothetical protein